MIKSGIIPLEAVENQIFNLRGHRVMLDGDLAELYGVETRALNQAVKRNKDRFPEDFMFQLNNEEAKAVLISRSQIVILKQGRNIKYRPYVFTEHGAVMLANVLKSSHAVQASILVVRAFVHLRQSLMLNRKLLKKLEMLEGAVGKHDEQLKKILSILHQMLEPPPLKLPKRKLGF